MAQYGVALVQCTCKNEYQDKIKGVGNRIANATMKQDKDYVEVRCTVCKKIHRVRPSQVK